MTTAYPLAWPFGWARTPVAHRSRGKQFYTRGQPVTFERARRLLVEELERMRAEDVILSTNIPLRADGMPRSDAHRYTTVDPGVAIYFKVRGRSMVMAQDAFDNPAANCRSLGLAVEAMRALERHGGGAMMDRAFTGFLALPPKRSCWDILDIRPRSSVEDIRAAHRHLMIEYNQRGAIHDEVAALNAARDDALREVAPPALPPP